MKKLLVLFFCCCNYQLKAQNNEAVNAYLPEQYKQLAIDEMIRTSVPASITLAQGILESNAGQCQLTEESIIILALNAKPDWAGDFCFIMMMMLKWMFQRSYKLRWSLLHKWSFRLFKKPLIMLRFFNLDIFWLPGLGLWFKINRICNQPGICNFTYYNYWKYNLEDITVWRFTTKQSGYYAAAPVKLQEEYAFWKSF